MPDIWFKRSCNLLQDPEFRPVLLTHGPGAATVYEELLGLAKLAKCRGELQTTFAVVAERAVVKRPACRKIVSSLEKIAFLRVLNIEGDELHVVMSGWEKWNPTDPTNAARQARYRERNALRNGSSNAEPVTDNTEITALDNRRETVDNPPNPPRGKAPEIPVRPSGGRARDTEAYEAQVREYAEYHFPMYEEPERTQYVLAAFGWARDPDHPEDEATDRSVAAYVHQYLGDPEIKETA